MIKNINTPRITGIQIGDNTHHQDQSATKPICANFSVMKTTSKILQRLQPDELFSDIRYIIFLLLILNILRQKLPH